MQSANERYKTLLKINNAIINQNSKESLFNTLSRELQKVLDHDRFSINIYNEKTDSLSYLTTAEGVTPQEINWDHRPLEHASIAKAVIEEKKPLTIHNLEDYISWRSARAMLDAGLQGSIACPLIVRSKVLGSFHLSFCKTPPNIDEIAEFIYELSSQVGIAVENMLAQTKLQEVNKDLQEQKKYLMREVEKRYYADNFFFNSSEMKNIMVQAKMIAETDASVLITGETGTGKDYIARCIHSLSSRREALFVKINCPTLTDNLFESELFGHAKGAFTGAHTKRVGRFEMAKGGTVFLDEIGELPIYLQAKLLQVLQDKTFERVGDSRSIHLDFRVIAATNKTTENLLSEKQFRSDLFYRINTVSLFIPPLRKRIRDIPTLLENLNIVESKKNNKLPLIWTDSAIAFLCQYNWPGNVRELKNLVNRLVIFYPNQRITPKQIESMLHGYHEQAETSGEESGSWPSLDQVEKMHIEKALTQTCGKIGGRDGAAALLGIPRTTLLYRIRKHDLKTIDFKKFNAKLVG